jgi:hypothetical protein
MGDELAPKRPVVSRSVGAGKLTVPKSEMEGVVSGRSMLGIRTSREGRRGRWVVIGRMSVVRVSRPREGDH